MKQFNLIRGMPCAEKIQVGERVRGIVTRVTDFGAFVELEPGIEGLIHLSEMSWVKKVEARGICVKPGESVEAMILGSTPTNGEFLSA